MHSFIVPGYSLDLKLYFQKIIYFPIDKLPNKNADIDKDCVVLCYNSNHFNNDKLIKI